MDKDLLHGWIKTYNKYTKLHEAAKREHYFELFSGDKGNVIRSKDEKVLDAIIMKTNGDPQKLKTLVGNINFQSDHNF